MTTLTPQEILHINLNSEISDLIPTAIYPVLYVVFWWYEIPLGNVEFMREQLPMSGDQLKQMAVRAIAPAIASHLEEYGLQVPDIIETILQDNFVADDIFSQWEKPFLSWRQQRLKPTELSISVIICTRDRPDYLKTCLESLQNLSYPPDEIVVVDNAPTSDATQKIVAQTSRVKYVLEPQPGLDFARNAGIRNSTSELIAYVDDDVHVHPDWVLQLRQAFQQSDVMAVTGLVLAAEINSSSQYVFEKYWSFNRGYKTLIYDRQYFDKFQFLGAPSWQIGAGANMAFRRSVFGEVGLFDERLDVGAAGCSGDSEMWYRILASGWSCRYDPTATVYHSHRREMTALQKQIFSYMRGHVTELLIRFERYRHWGNLVRLCMLPIYLFYVYLNSFRILHGELRRSTLLSEVSGSLSGIKFYTENKISTRNAKKT